MRIHTYLSLLCFCLLGIANITSQTTWQGPADGDWFTPANWNNGLPAPGNNATIGGGASVVIGSPLTVNFTIDNFGTLTADAAITIVSGGTFNSSFALTVSSTGSLTNNATFRNFATATFQSAATFTNEAGATFQNNGGFTLQTTLVNKGFTINFNLIDATNGTLNSQGNFQNNGTLNTKTLTVAPGSTFTNNFGTVNISGAGATFLAEGNIDNQGFINNNGTLTIKASFINGVQLTNSSSMTIEAGATLTNNGTVNNAGSLTNNGTIANGNQFTNTGTANNNGTFNNNSILNNAAGGAFNNNAGGVLNQAFGTELLNGATFVNAGIIVSVGLIQNDNTFTNNGSIVCNSGNKLDNNGSNFTNYGSITTANLVQNDGSFFNFGTMNVNAGSVLENSGNFTNRPGAAINNLSEVKNKPGGIFTNNGTLNNGVRLFIEGNFINNAFLNSAGNIFIEPGGTLTNTELVYLNAGNLKNQGTLVNSNKIWVNDCSSLNNVAGASINNNGNLELHGILFQRGTLNGNAVNNQGGFIHTAAGSAAPSICQNGIFPADINGDVKVYASQLISNANFDSCANIVYLANGVDRPVFHCTDIGSVLNVNVVLRTSLNDELTCVAQVTPVDKLEPQFSNCPKDQVIFTPNPTVPATWIAPTATDNCTTVTLTPSHSPGASFPVGITGVTYTAKDTYNNQNQCQFRIEARKTAPGGNCSGDATPPAFVSCPGNISKTTNGTSAIVGWLPPTATDNCYPIVLTGSHSPGAAFGLGSTTVTYTAKDGNNNSSTCTFTVTVTQNNACAGDVTKPIINGCPKNIYLPTNPVISGAVAVWTQPGAFDFCGVTQFTGTHTSGSVFPTGTTTVIYTAKDAANNTSACSFTVTVGADPCPGDVAAPAISGCPANINLTVPGFSGTATWTAPYASDACAPVTLNATHTPGSVFFLGSTQLSYQFSDKKGNTSFCNFNVNVQNSCAEDATPPTISGCPSNITVGTSGTSAPATWTPPTVSDNCDMSYFAAAYLPGGVFSLGTTNVVYTAIDVEGNASNCSFNVIVVNAPGCTTNAAPINGTTNVNPASVTLSWVTAAGASSYDVYLGTTNPPSTSVATNVAGTSTVLTGLLGGTTYWWYVVPKNAAGSATGCGSTATNFVTTAIPCNVCTGNLLTNGCFENGLTGFVASGGATPTSPGRTGALAGYMCNNGGKLEYPLVGIVGGIYTFSGWATKSNNNTAGNFSLVFKNAAGTVLSTTSSTLNLNAWKQYTITATAPANTATVIATVTKTSNAGCITTDDWCLTVVMPCNNVTNAGTIAAAQIICPNGDPVALTSTAPASGGSGTLTYKWQKTTLDPASNPNSWTDIAGTNAELYNPPALSVSTWFRRGAVREFCSTYLFTSALKVTVSSLPPTAICQNVTKTQTAAGQTITITAAEVNNGSTAGCGSITNMSVLPSSFNALGTYTVTLTVTNTAGLTGTCTATVTIVSPCNNVTNGGAIAKACASNQIILSNSASPSGGSGTLEYRWLSGTSDCNASNMSPVSGATAATFTVTVPSVQTYYIRQARRVGCSNWVSSNCITVEANECLFDPGKCYKVVNKYSGKVLDIFGSEMADNTKAIQWTLHGGDNQKFRFTPAGGGYFHIMARHSAKFLDTENAGSTSDNAKAVQYNFDGSNSQQWKIESVGSGYFKITNKLSNKALKIKTASSDDGIDVVQLGYSNSDVFKWQIVEVPCCDQDALLVVGNTTLNAGDTWVKNRLQTLGFTVTVRDDAAVVAGDASGKGIVVISSTCNSDAIGTEFTSSNVPVVCWESYLFDELKMSGGNEEVDHGTSSGSSLTIYDANHPLAAGLSGTVQVYSSGKSMRWGWTTISSAAKVAKLGSASKYGVFGYEKGAAMPGEITAPARRVGLFMDDGTPQYLTANGIKLFDAAINWASKCNGFNLGEEVMEDRSEAPKFEVPASNLSSDEITVFPNPAQDRLFVNLSKFAGKETLIRLVNVNGQVTKEWEIIASDVPVELPMENSGSGYHMLWILPEGEKRVVTVKVVIGQ